MLSKKQNLENWAKKSQRGCLRKEIKNLGGAGERKREGGRQWEGEVGRERGREKWERRKRLWRRKRRGIRDMEHKGKGRKG